jgi:sugar (pentulose or hexulose) kinase
MRNAYLGIDVGTQGLSLVLVDEAERIVASSEGQYQMLPNLDPGCYEQNPLDWEKALESAMADLSRQPAVLTNYQVEGIGVAGQMHGEVLVDEEGSSLGPARLWCDRRNEAEGIELTESFGIKIPKRMTVARWLWTLRNQPEKARRTRGITTPAGWITFRLTGQRNLGIGDASGMFPIDQRSLDYDERLLEQFHQVTKSKAAIGLRALLPHVRRAGEEAGRLNESGSRLLGLAPGIPVAAAEGDQPASLAGSRIGSAGMVAVSFGTSVCANSIGDRTFQGVSQAVDHFCAPDGKPINMVFLRNGTTFMNSLIEMLAAVRGGRREDLFSEIIADALNSPPDCGGLLAMPFIDDEPGLGVSEGSQGAITGLNAQNATAGNMVKSALLATMFNLRLGIEVLDQQSFPRTELFLSGGLTRSPDTGQILADVMQSPVKVMAEAAEGCAFGAALLAKYRAQISNDKAAITWEDFLQHRAGNPLKRFAPDPRRGMEYGRSYHQYRTHLKSVVRENSNPLF